MRQVFVLFVVTFLVISGAGAYTDVAYSKQWIRKTPVHVVTANLNSPNVKVSPAIARNGIGTSEGFGSMLSRLQPSAAITGTYFCIKSLVPVGDIVVDRKLVNSGCVGTGVCFTEDNRVIFQPIDKNKPTDWTGYTSVICTGPRLVTDGVPYVAPWAEGFNDPAHYKVARRSALGVTRNNKLLLVTVNRSIYLSKFAKIMHDLGAVNAVSLDGGTSTALYYKGRVPSHPGRRMTNLLVVYESSTKFAKIKSQLVPSTIVATSSSKS